MHLAWVQLGTCIYFLNELIRTEAPWSQTTLTCKMSEVELLFLAASTALYMKMVVCF